MNLSKIASFIEEKNPDWKKGSEWWSDYFNVPVEEIKKARETEIITNAAEGSKKDIEQDEELYQSFQEFLEQHNINEDDVTNVWYKQRSSGTYFSVETRKYKDGELDFDPTEAFRQSIEQYKIPDYTPKINKQDLSTKRAGIINLFDAHIDKICSLKDTDEESSIDKNIKDFEKCFNEILESIAQKAPEVIYFPVGNDFFHTNDFTLTTKKGTPQSDKVHVTGIEAFRIGLTLLRKCIDKARSIAPVIIIPIRGNHDEDRIRYLLECLLIAYEKQQDVDIIDTHKSRIYQRYGKWLFGFAHGDKGIKLKEYPSYMSTDKEGKKHWSDIERGIFFLGHYHHEQKYDTLKNKDFKGCSVYMLRATTGSDSWHWSEGWTGIPRTAYGYIFDKDGTRDYEIKVNL